MQIRYRKYYTKLQKQKINKYNHKLQEFWDMNKRPNLRGHCIEQVDDI